MKKFFLHLVLSLSVITVSFSQNLIQNGDFQNCSSFSPGCTPWEVSHGGPGIDSESNGNHYVYLISGSSAYGQALTNGLYYPGISFSTYYEYQLTFKIKSDGGAFNVLTVKLANGLTPRNIGGTVPLPTVTNQLINTSYAESDIWETVSLTFRPTADYNQLWLYCYDGVGVTLLDDVTLTKTLIGDNGCCSPNITYSNNTGTNPLPGFTKRSDYIKANTNVKVMSGSTAIFQAGQYILLEPSFETQSTSTFVATIAPCSTNVRVVANAGPDVYRQFNDSDPCATLGMTPVYGVNYSWSSTVPAKAETWAWDWSAHPPSYYGLSFSSTTVANPVVCFTPRDAMGVYVDNTLTVSSSCWASSSDVMRYTYYLGYPTGNRHGAPEETPEEGLSVFPNPSSGKFTVSVPSSIKEYKMIVKDINGREVYSCIQKGNEHSIELTGIPAGMYFITIQSGDVLLKNKVVIQ